MHAQAGLTQDCSWAGGCPLHLLMPSRGAWAGPANCKGQARLQTPQLRVDSRAARSVEEPGNAGEASGGRRGHGRGAGCQAEAGPGPAGAAPDLPGCLAPGGPQTLGTVPPSSMGARASTFQGHTSHTHTRTFTHTHFLIGQTTWSASPEAALEPGPTPRLAWTAGARFSGLSGTW